MISVINNYRWFIVLLSFCWLAIGKFNVFAQDGEAVFKANCTSCHKIHDKLVGPALKGVHERWDGKEAELVAFIKNSQNYMKAGKAKSDYAMKLFQEYNGTVMTAFETLTDAEIKSVLAYIKTEGAKAPPVAAGAPPAGAAGAVQGAQGQPSSLVVIGLISITGGLVIICFFMLFVVAILINAVRAKEARKGEVVRPFTAQTAWQSFLEIIRSRFVATLLFLVVAGAGLTGLVKTARSVGVHQGYAPAQPIAFSHKLHAGQYKIGCNYCHTGVEKGKGAIIPSTNICMNCHNWIHEGPKYGKKEIAKILTSYQEDKPIEWVRVHNLPDMVYFNHAQHVKVGGIQCQKCHGPVEEMEVMYQYSPLTMGWCINCHRETNVDVTKSEYYLKVHDELQNLGKEHPITVEKLGGLECSKCHY